MLTAVKKEKLFTPDSPVKKITGRLEAEASNFAHSKVAETEKENSAVEGHTRPSRKPKIYTALSSGTIREAAEAAGESGKAGKEAV